LALICILTLIGNWWPSKSTRDGVSRYPVHLCHLRRRRAPGEICADLHPTIAYIGTISLVLTIPGMPFSKEILAAVGKVNFLALATPIIASPAFRSPRTWTRSASKAGALWWRPDHPVFGILQRGHHRRGLPAHPGLPALIFQGHR